MMNKIILSLALTGVLTCGAGSADAQYPYYDNQSNAAVNSFNGVGNVQVSINQDFSNLIPQFAMPQFGMPQVGYPQQGFPQQFGGVNPYGQVPFGPFNNQSNQIFQSGNGAGNNISAVNYGGYPYGYGYGHGNQSNYLINSGNGYGNMIYSINQ